MQRITFYAMRAALALVVMPLMALASAPGKMVAKVKTVPIGGLSGHETLNCQGCDKCLKRG